jgi:hypothetical protein
MSVWISELGLRMVVGHKRDGRCVYSAQAKQELVIACRRSWLFADTVGGANANANLY